MTELNRNPFVWNMRTHQYFQENNSPRVSELWEIPDAKKRAKMWVWFKSKAAKLDPLNND